MKIRWPFLISALLVGFAGGIVFEQGKIPEKKPAPKIIALREVPDAQDRAGAWGEFHGGRSGGTGDFHWELELEVSEPATIVGMTLLHNVPGEFWTTTSQKRFNKSGYPIVLFREGAQQNSEYDTRFEGIGPGRIRYNLFVQPASQPFSGGRLEIEFADGRTLVTEVSPASPASVYPPCPGPIPFELGKRWIVQEGIWSGIWERNGDSESFTAQWSSPLGNAGPDQVTFVRRNDREVELFRKGTNGFYRGVLSCDGSAVIDGRGDWFAGGDRWKAAIQTGADPRAP